MRLAEAGGILLVREAAAHQVTKCQVSLLSAAVEVEVVGAELELDHVRYETESTPLWTVPGPGSWRSTRSHSKTLLKSTQFPT